MATQHGQRLVFENAKNLVANAGFNVNQAVLSQSYIRSEIAMSTSTTSYHVPVLVNDTQNGNAFATENRLQLQDAAVISSVGVYVAIPASASTTAFPLYSYPNAVVFSRSLVVDNKRLDFIHIVSWRIERVVFYCSVIWSKRRTIISSRVSSWNNTPISKHS